VSESKDPVTFLHRDLSTGNQVGMLLSICGAMADLVFAEPAEPGETPGTRPEVAGEAGIAAEVTFIKACDRLDKILDDSSRWGMDYQLSLEKLFEENTRLAHQMAEKQAAALTAETEKANAQRTAAESAQTPHFIYRPMLTKSESGEWIAFLGDPKDQDTCVFGLGGCPEAAVKAFDLAFLGVLSEKQQRTVVDRKIELNENDSVDQSGDCEAEEPASSEGDSAGDSGKAGAHLPGG
jgi:hypothetical protein